MKNRNSGLSDYLLYLVIDAAQMTEEQLHAKLHQGYDDYKAGRTHNAAEAFAKFRESHS